MELELIDSVEGVIDALGGTSATASLLGYRQMQPVSEWKRRGRLPADKFLLMQEALRARGKTAPPALWGIATQPIEAAE